MHELVHPRALHDGSVGGKRAAQDGDTPSPVDRRVERMQHRAVKRGRVEIGQLLGHRAAAHGQRVAVEQPGVEQGTHDDRHPAHLVQVVHHVLAEGPDVGHVRHSPPDPVEVVQGQFHPGLVRNRQQVQDGVGRAAERHHHGDRVLEGLPGEDPAGGDAVLDLPEDGLPGAAGEHVAATVHRWRRRAPDQAHAQPLGGTGHRVRGEHAPATALAGTGRALDLGQPRVVDAPAGAGPDRLEDLLDRDASAVGQPAGQDRPAVEKRGSEVEPRSGHEHPGQALVAAGQQHGAVEPLGVHHQFHRVGDDLAGHERGAHPLVAHRDPVADGDRAELQRDAAGLPHAGLGLLGETLQRQVAGSDLVPGRGDADLWPVPVVVAEADSTQHGPGGRPFDSLGDVPAAGLGRTDRVLEAHARELKPVTVGARVPVPGCGAGIKAAAPQDLLRLAVLPVRQSTDHSRRF